MSESKLALEVRAYDLRAQLTVFDHDFNVVGRGVGRLETSLPRGLYKVRLEIGGAIREGHVALEQKSESNRDARLVKGPAEMKVTPTASGADVTFAEVHFPSPIPLDRTTRTHEYHLYNAQQLSGANPTLTTGDGAEILLFSRVWSKDNRFANKWHPLSGLSLHADDGSQLSDLEKDALSNLTGDPWAGLKASVSPGCYRLRNNNKKTPIEMCLFAPKGWQLQVFLLAGSAPTDTPEIDFDGAAVLLSQQGFNPTDYEWRLTEQARKSLASRSIEAKHDDVRQMLYRKFASPMLGIFGAHFLLREEKHDKNLLDEVLGNLRYLVGVHPDVEAIALGYGAKVLHPNVFAVPPMLSTSWDVIVRATAEDESLVPADSYAATGGARGWTSCGPWLLWSTPPARKSSRFESTLGGEDPVEERLWNYWVAQFHASWPSEPERPKESDVNLEALVRRLTQPRSVLARATSALAKRVTGGSTPAERFASNAIQMMAKSTAES